MDLARAPHNAQARLKQVLTPIWTKEMGHRLRVARMKQGRSQGDLAAVMSITGDPISKQTISKIESGRLRHMRVTWARLEACLGSHIYYVLIARDRELYDEAAIALRFFDTRFRALRKRNGRDPKKGEAAPWPHRFSLETRIRLGRELPKKRGSVR